jgi:IS30 family transposase
MYCQLTYKERCHIEVYLQEGYLISKIARHLNRARSTVRSEVARHKNNDTYNANAAHAKAVSIRETQKLQPRKIKPEIWAYVDQCLAKFWSPEQISGVLKNEGVSLSHEWIYQHVWKNKAASGDLHHCLRRSGKKYNKRASKDAGRGCIRNRVDIEHRPAIVEARKRIGDWEGDLVLGKENTGAVVTLVERKTRFTKLHRINRKTAAETNVAISKAFKSLPPAYLVTLTFDNGKEFAWHEHITNALGIDIYFARPYHSWERGLNENTNGLLRQYLPKGSSFADLTEAHLQWIESELNNRPRKCLGFKTPRQMMELGMAA